MQLRLFPHCTSSAIVLWVAISVSSAEAQQAATGPTNLIATKSTSAVTGVNVNLSRENRFKLLSDKMAELKGNPARNWDEYERGARELIKEFPDRPDGYQDLMVMLQYGKRDRAHVLAMELADSSAPERFKLWAKGFLYRLDSFGKPVKMQFAALDGREVNLAKMRGKVVLIDFWGTTCVPCVAALPDIRAVYDKYHAQGFEVIGISFDSNKAHLTRFIKEKELPWPQYFDGKQGVDSKFGQEFGISGIPHTLLLDKKGALRIDNIDIGPSFEAYVSKLLSEP